MINYGVKNELYLIGVFNHDLLVCDISMSNMTYVCLLLHDTSFVCVLDSLFILLNVYCIALNL